MKIGKQIAVALQNRPGQLGHLCRSLAGLKINILAISVTEAADVSVVRLVVDKTAAAVRALKKFAVTTATESVILIEVTDKPGTMAVVARRLGEANVNISFCYASAAGDAGCLLVLGVSDLAKAKIALEGM